jgi:hypothetical protein
MGTTIATEGWTIVNDGGYPVRPVIVITGPVEDWVIENTTTGDELTWDGYAIAAAEVVTLDIPNKTITNGAGTSLITYASGNFGTFELAPGNNIITFWASGNVVNAATTVQFCWYLEVFGI